MPSLLVCAVYSLRVCVCDAPISRTTACLWAFLRLSPPLAASPSTWTTSWRTSLPCNWRRWTCRLSCRTTPPSTSYSSTLLPSLRPPSSPPRQPCPPRPLCCTTTPRCTRRSPWRPLGGSGRTSLSCRPRRTSERPLCRGGARGGAVAHLGTSLAQEARPPQERNSKVGEF